MWVKIDDKFYQHPKIVAVGPLGMALQVAALCYCNQYLTDGFIPWNAAKGLLVWEFLGPPVNGGKRRSYTIDVACGMEGGPVETSTVIDLMLSAGIWLETDGGYLIHDYGDFQKSKSEIESVQNIRKESGRRGGQAKAKQTSSKVSNKSQANALAKSYPVPDPLPNSDPVPTPKDLDAAQVPTSPPKRKRKPKVETGLNGAEIWVAYSCAYSLRYGVPPVRNARQNALCKQLRARLGADAENVIASYLGSQNAYYCQRRHPLDAAVRDAEKLASDWRLQSEVTQSQARQGDKRATEAAGWAAIIAKSEKGE